MAKALTSLRIDSRLVRKAQRVLRTKSKTQTIEMCLEAVVEIEKHRRLIIRYGGKAKPSDFSHNEDKIDKALRKVSRSGRIRKVFR